MITPSIVSPVRNLLLHSASIAIDRISPIDTGRVCLYVDNFIVDTRIPILKDDCHLENRHQSDPLHRLKHLEKPPHAVEIEFEYLAER